MRRIYYIETDTSFIVLTVQEPKCNLPENSTLHQVGPGEIFNKRSKDNAVISDDEDMRDSSVSNL